LCLLSVVRNMLRTFLLVLVIASSAEFTHWCISAGSSSSLNLFQSYINTLSVCEILTSETDILLLLQTNKTSCRDQQPPRWTSFGISRYQLINVHLSIRSTSPHSEPTPCISQRQDSMPQRLQSGGSRIRSRLEDPQVCR